MKGHVLMVCHIGMALNWRGWPFSTTCMWTIPNNYKKKEKKEKKKSLL